LSSTSTDAVAGPIRNKHTQPSASFITTARYIAILCDE